MSPVGHLIRSTRALTVRLFPYASVATTTTWTARRLVVRSVFFPDAESRTRILPTPAAVMVTVARPSRLRLPMMVAVAEHASLQLNGTISPALRRLPSLSDAAGAIKTAGRVV